MTIRHYDVIVVGRSLGALAAAALLSRRDYRVLVVGHGQPKTSYRFEGRTLRRSAFTFLAAQCPTFRRLLHELAQSQTFRRKLRALDPMFTVFGSSFRLEVPPSVELFAREIDREFPEVRGVVDEMYSTFAAANAAADSAFDCDFVFPPGTLWERFETSRATSGLPLTDIDAEALLAKFPPLHPYRDVTLLPAVFASDLSPSEHAGLPAFALSRLHGSWTRGIASLDGGYDELEEFFVERIQAHGGQCRFEQKVGSIIVRGKAACGIVEEGEEHPTHGDYLVLALSGEEVADLSRGEGITRAAEREWPRVSPASGRFVTSVVVKTQGLPESLPEESFLMPDRARKPDPRRLPVRLQRVAERNPEHPDETLLVAEALLPERGALTQLEARQAVLSELAFHLPFLERHLVLVDSPHDGLPLYDYTSGIRRDVDRIHVPEARPLAEPMQRLYRVEPRGYLGLGGEPVRGPVPNTFLVGGTVLPALGQEGQLLAAASVARLITRRDWSRHKMRRDMWTKIETG